LRIGDKNIDPKVREAWKMQLIPIDEAVREIQIRDAREEGMERGMDKSKLEVARSMLADGLTAETIRKYTGLDESSILSLR
jgi:predicted transposase/invertase (TIGR01784 family)